MIAPGCGTNCLMFAVRVGFCKSRLVMLAESLGKLDPCRTVGGEEVRRTVFSSSPDEGGLPGGVLAHHQHHGPAVEVGVLVGGRVEVVEAAVLLDGQQPLVVEVFQLLRHHLHLAGRLRVAPQPPDGHGDESSAFFCCFSTSRFTALQTNEEEGFDLVLPQL